MPENLDENTITQSISETLLPKLIERINGNIPMSEKFRLSFDSHTRVIWKYIYERLLQDNSLSLDLLRGLHTLLYPKDFKILVYRQWVCYENFPGKWRLHDFNPQILTSYWSAQKDIEKDLVGFTSAYNSLQNKTRADIVKYYFDFLRVHPFGDSNLTVIAIICDLECRKYWFLPLQILDMRFKDKQFLLYCLTYYEKNIYQENILEESLAFIDNFHNGTLSDKIIEEKTKQIVFSTAQLL